MRFKNREDAARLLAERLRPYCEGERPLVLAIPRGAVPMAKVIADALDGDLDVVLVHKLGHPDQPELAIGAIDETGGIILSDWAEEAGATYIESEKQRQLATLRQRRAQYTPLREPMDPSGRLTIVVDDGTATGSTMTAALRAVSARHPKKLFAAVAVASERAAEALLAECDGVICLHVPANFSAVGQFFKDFSQVSDEQVVEVLRCKQEKIVGLGVRKLRLLAGQRSRDEA